jgi:hypothetical protein
LNPMPESISDRCTKSHEYIFMLAKSADYFYDAEAIKEPNSINPNWDYGSEAYRRDASQDEYKIDGDNRRRKEYPKGWSGFASAGPNGSGRNKRSVWTVATQPYPEAHFATFPEDLIKPCILAGTSQRGACVECGAPWERVVETQRWETRPGLNTKYDDNGMESGRTRKNRTESSSKTLGWRPTCYHSGPRENGKLIEAIHPTRPCTILDPFAGSGTTVKVAQDLGRVGIGLDLKTDYLKMARHRTAQQGLAV